MSAESPLSRTRLLPAALQEPWTRFFETRPELLGSSVGTALLPLTPDQPAATYSRAQLLSLVSALVSLSARETGRGGPDPTAVAACHVMGCLQGAGREAQQLYLRSLRDGGTGRGGHCDYTAAAAEVLATLPPSGADAFDTELHACLLDLWTDFAALYGWRQ